LSLKFRPKSCYSKKVNTVKIIYARYKRVRNDITSEIRKAKARYFEERIASVKSAAAYWNLIAEATNPVRRSRIGP